MLHLSKEFGMGIYYIQFSHSRPGKSSLYPSEVSLRAEVLGDDDRSTSARGLRVHVQHGCAAVRALASPCSTAMLHSTARTRLDRRSIQELAANVARTAIWWMESNLGR